MNTKYNVGDILVVSSYYGEIFAASVVKIIIDINNTTYELDYLDKSGTTVKVPETGGDVFFYNIVRKVGNIFDKQLDNTETDMMPLQGTA